MALFDLFGSKKTPAKKTVTVKAVPKRKRYDETAGVINTGVDVYSFNGTPEEYFAQVLKRNFSGYEIRTNVAFEEICDISAPTPVPASASGSWKCTCGSLNSDNFCPECGAKRPDPNEWVCPVCKKKNTSKFCPACGQAKPAPAPATSARSDEGPAVSLGTLIRKSVAADISKNTYPRLNFVIFKNGKPAVAIYLCPKADYDNIKKWDVVNRLDMACRMKKIAFQRYFKEFRNDEAYVCQRIRWHLD